MPGTRDASPESVGYTITEHQLQHVDDPPPDQVTVASGSWFEVCCGALGLALAVVGIQGNNPLLMSATATVTLGFGVFAQAGTIATRSNRSERDELLGVTTDLVAGLAAIVLGVLVLVHIVPFAWLPIATIALGVGLMFAARVEIGGETPSPRWNAWSHVVMLAAGLAAIVLALVAFASVAPTTLALVADACVGGGLLFVGGATPTLRGISNGEGRKE